MNCKWLARANDATGCMQICLATTWSTDCTFAPSRWSTRWHTDGESTKKSQTYAISCYLILVGYVLTYQSVTCNSCDNRCNSCTRKKLKQQLSDGRHLGHTLSCRVHFDKVAMEEQGQLVHSITWREEEKLPLGRVKMSLWSHWFTIRHLKMCVYPWRVDWFNWE